MISRHFLLLLLLPGIASIELRLFATDDELPAKQVQWFETNIRPILATKCYSCHAERDDKDEGGLTLDTRQGWEKGGDHGPAIVPKDADASLIIRAVRYSDPDLQMPLRINCLDPQRARERSSAPSVIPSKKSHCEACAHYA